MEYPLEYPFHGKRKLIWKMSHIVCPLCGLSVPMSKFWETIYEDIDDIEAVNFRGLGLGRGFEKSEIFSVLDDEEICEAVAARCYAILELVGEDLEEDDKDLEEV